MRLGPNLKLILFINNSLRSYFKEKSYIWIPPHTHTGYVYEADNQLSQYLESEVQGAPGWDIQAKEPVTLKSWAPWPLQAGASRESRY